MTSSISTGLITVAQSLDREEAKFYWLTLSARDNGLVSLEDYMHVMIEVTDVNDNCPITTQPYYYIRFVVAKQFVTL